MQDSTLPLHSLNGVGDRVSLLSPQDLAPLLAHGLSEVREFGLRVLAARSEDEQAERLGTPLPSGVVFLMCMDESDEWDRLVGRIARAQWRSWVFSYTVGAWLAARCVIQWRQAGKARAAGMDSIVDELSPQVAAKFAARLRDLGVEVTERVVNAPELKR